VAVWVIDGSKTLMGAQYCARPVAASISVREFPNYARRIPCRIVTVPRIGVRTMRRTNAPRSIAIARRSDDMQPGAILGALAMIATLMLIWIGFAA
jgi:hypothetical protein